jgi:hypothetical protein
VRYYGFGGDGPGSACDTHTLDAGLRIAWYANPPNCDDKDNYNWRYEDFHSLDGLWMA